MDYSFYEILIPQIKRLVEKRGLKDFIECREVVEKNWFYNKPGNSMPKTVYGVDGGSYSVEFKGSVLAVVTAISLGYSLEDEAYHSIDSIKTALIDTILPPRYASERVSLYRETLEGKVACHSCRDGSLVLMDGTIASVLIAPRPRHPSVREVLFRKTDVEAVTSLISRDNPLFYEVFSKCIEDVLGKQSMLMEKPMCTPVLDYSFVDKNLIDYVVTIVEYLEKLYTYGHLLKRVYSGECSLVYIAKNSYSSDILEVVNYPDIILFERLTSKPGFSTIKVKKLTEIKHIPSAFLPKHISSILEYFDKLCVYYGYVRLGDKTPVLKMEVIDRCGVDSIDLFRRYHSLLFSISVDGYPFPLKTAHLDSHITYSDVDRLLHILGFDIESTGREVLE